MKEEIMKIINTRLSIEQFTAIQNQLQPKIEDGLVQSVDARRLHAWLEVGKDFSNWVKYQIERAALVEHEDYEVFAKNGEQDWGGSNRKEYALSPDAAKEIAMMSSSDKGKLIRNYFLDCEKSAKAAAPTTYLQALEKLVEEVRAREQLQLENQQAQLVIQERTEDVQVLKGALSNREYEKLMTPTELSRELSANIEWSVIEGEKLFNWNPSSHDIMDYLRDQKFIFKSEDKVSQKGIDNYADTIVFEQYGMRKQLKFNINSQQFVRFVKDMKKFMLANRKGLHRNKFVPGVEF